MTTTTSTPGVRPLRTLAVTGAVAVPVAVVVTTLAAAAAQALGVDFELPDGGESIPLSGFAFITGVFSVVGVVLAVGLLRWSPRPAEHFVRVTGGLTAVSLVPPFLVGANAATVVSLVVLHLVAAGVMIPSLARALGRR